MYALFYVDNALVRKWRNIKDTYLKTLKKRKSGPGCKKGRQYLYAKELSFLRQTCLITKTKSSLNSEQPLSDKDNEELRAATELKCNQDNQPSNINFNNTHKHKRDLKSSQLPFMNASHPPSTITTVQSNPNQSFFQSLIPILNGFTEEEVIDFRMEVLSIIKKMQKVRQNLAQTANLSNLNFMGYPSHPGTHNTSMIYSHHLPSNFTLTPTLSGQLSTGLATVDIQTYPLLHHAQNPHKLYESHYPSLQPSTSFMPASTNLLIPPQTSYPTENTLKILNNSQNRHHNTASNWTYSTQKLSNIQQPSRAPLCQLSSTKYKTIESHVCSLPSQDSDSYNSSQYSVSPSLTSLSSVNESEDGIKNECPSLLT